MPSGLLTAQSSRDSHEPCPSPPAAALSLPGAGTQTDFHNDAELIPSLPAPEASCPIIQPGLWCLVPPPTGQGFFLEAPEFLAGSRGQFARDAQTRLNFVGEYSIPCIINSDWHDRALSLPKVGTLVPSPTRAFPHLPARLPCPWFLASPLPSLSGCCSSLPPSLPLSLT